MVKRKGDGGLKGRHKSKTTHSQPLGTVRHGKEKPTSILHALATKDREKLCYIARHEGGFKHNSIRRKAWPILLRYAQPPSMPDDAFDKHKDENQVWLDVIRSFGSFPNNIPLHEKESLQSDLNHLITKTLRQCPGLHYYQGFHDVCAVFLLIWGPKRAIPLVEHVALFYLRDAMLESLEPILRELSMLDTLIQKQDPTLYAFLNQSGVMPYYCLSWIITWYSHDLSDLDQILRLFDFFLASTPLMPLYLAAAVVLSRRSEILALPCDLSELHGVLSKIPRNLAMPTLIAQAIELEELYPAEILQASSGIALDAESVVNTFAQWRDKDHSIAADKRKAKNILAMSPTERTPIPLKSLPFKHPRQNLHNLHGPLWAWIAVGASVGTLAILLGHQHELFW